MTSVLPGRASLGASASTILLERLPELDGVAPMDLAERLRWMAGLSLLESARPGRNAVWSYLTADPRFVIDAPSDGPDPFAAARAAVARLSAGSPQDAAGVGRDSPRFLGGLVGWISYDLGRRLERLPTLATDDQTLPLLRLQLHDWALAHDRRTGAWWLGGRALDGDSAELERRLVTVRAAVASGSGATVTRGLGDARAPGADAPAPTADAPAPSADAREPGAHPPAPDLRFVSGLDRPAYMAGVEAIREAIARGEIYQANLTRRLETRFAGDPWPLYRRLRTGDPALFAAYLPVDRGNRRAILSASPEPYLSVTADGRVATDPIKGTRPRGRDRADDRRLAHELLCSAKDRAENVMIVDVLRNDLGRVCVPGTVRVPRLCRLERTAAVQHLVSTVTGRLAPGRDAFDLLLASFPGGSITGAPKIRAMQLLESLEPVRRGPYTGAAGWIGPDGAMQTSILIRSFVADGDRLTLHVGGGITWRSDPAQEWQETVDKAHGPLSSIGGIELDRIEVDR